MTKPFCVLGMISTAVVVVVGPLAAVLNLQGPLGVAAVVLVMAGTVAALVCVIGAIVSDWVTT